MRQLKIVLIVLISMIMLGLCTFLWIALAGEKEFGGRFRAEYSLVLEQEIPAEGIRSLKVDYSMSSNDVFFYQGTGDAVIIREYMNFEPEEKQISSVEQSGAELAVRGKRKSFFFFFSLWRGDSYTEIYLPAGFAEGMEKLEVKTVSGDIFSEIPFGLQGEFGVSSTSGDIAFPDVEAGKIRISSTSGNIRLTEAAAETVTVSTVSGDITMGAVKGEMNFSTTSGDVRLTEAAAETVTVSTVSGDITMGAVKGEMNFSTTSGDIRMEEGIGSFDADSVSGDIRADSLEGVFRINTTSGEITLSAGKGSGRVSTTSGDIRVFLAALDGDLNISTTSGTVGLELPETASFLFGFESVSGRCSTFFDEMLTFNKKGNKAEGRCGTGADTVKISTVSGDLSVAKYPALQYN